MVDKGVILMKLVLETNGVDTVIGEDFDFDSAYDWAMAHGEENDWAEEFNYYLIDENEDEWHIEADCWVKW
jgi:hypothetical protein